MFPIVPKFKDLRHLSIGMIYHDDPIWIDWTADGSVLESIFDLHSLESLDLADVPLRLTANNMKDIALAFPRLRKLHLSSNCSFYPVDVPACITVAVEDLSCFARHCPQMRELAITNTFVPIYTSQVPTPTPLPTESNLRELCLGQSHITDPQRVAAFCADVYPFAQITSNHIGCDEHGECWAKIVSSIDNMKNRMVVSRMLEERAAASRRTYHNVGVQVRPGDRDA
ncbi:uncharacterized protein PHACADRAFT_159813 [Phanerochaete carnosa HHB-10118-sp]|uniref:F-box domain-containing protein n=1 Tax=Phanerochaete carnosa (strain HHB-10118-sp) TaxID=650164 RepID=K5V172_PHACS|nr:uncharacterized protein PHACADRAFT_159813 [Phanerochaete carnosa HHB-10118-sp]EKM56236.1 hypothetical protein PHACADRAFT_159813 [Phanerochaete carnosa HHB-10118-sp]